jgi:hypothetical protein
VEAEDDENANKEEANTSHPKGKKKFANKRMKRKMICGVQTLMMIYVQ